MDAGGGCCIDGEHHEHFAVSYHGNPLLHHEGRLQAIAALQRHSCRLVASSWAPPKPEALLIRRLDYRDQKESLLDAVYIGLVSQIRSKEIMTLY